MKILNSLYHLVVPEAWRALLRTSLVLNRDYGQFRSFQMRSSVGPKGEPVPWLSYPAIFYLEQLDLGGCAVLEFGSGQSTRYWSRHAKSVLSVETDKIWFDLVSPTLPENSELLYFDSKEGPKCFEQIKARGIQWDIIVIDGSWRAACARELVAVLAPGGFIILDNPDWYPTAAETMSKSGLISVTFSGLCPGMVHTTTTAFYFSRDFDRKVAGRDSLLKIPGARPYLHEISEDQAA
jgi:hypothetical protein